MRDFCEKYANVSGKHGTIRLGAENYMLFANSENEPMGAIKIKMCPLCGRELTADDLGRDYVRGTMDGWNACLDAIDPR